MRLESKLSGFNELEKLLTQLPENVENRILQSAVTGAMREAAKDIRKAAPVGTEENQANKKYGKLKNNIKVRASKRDRRKGQRGAYINTGKAYWGYLLEVGTRYISARPWFAPTFRRSQDKIIKSLGVRLADGIVKEAKKFKGSR